MKNRIETIGLGLVVLFTTLTFGAVEPWSLFVFELLAAGMLVLWGTRFLASRTRTLFIPPVAWPLAGLILLGAAQSIAWTDASGTRQSLSMDVEATRRATLALAALFALCVVAANVLATSLQDRERLQRLAKIASLYGLVLALFGILRHFAFKGVLPWLGTVGSETLSATFVNRDHFAGYLELLVGIPVALIVTRCVRGEERYLLGVAATMMGVTLIFTLSRGGMISLFAELVFIAAMSVSVLRRNDPRVSYGTPARTSGLEQAMGASAVGGILLAIVLGVAWIGAEPIINRIATGSADGGAKMRPFEDHRLVIWKDTLRMISEHPVSGIGLGAFPTVYPMFTQSSGMHGIMAEAHNDYLQILADGGIIGGALAAWFLLILFRSIGQGLRSRDSMLAGLSLGYGAGALGLLTHSMFDFNLHLPSHALLFLIFSAIVSQIAVLADQPVRVYPAPAPAPVNLYNEVSS
ncbi:MAG: O-antigen ligase family protein [Blastocatellia bacterium]|nr:O-antigen ligase family protein [Blastocatellia bacterium]